MSVFIACPSCGVKLDIPETLLGKQVRCASCGEVFAARDEVLPASTTFPPQNAITELPNRPAEEMAPKRPDRGADYRELDDNQHSDDSDELPGQKYIRRDAMPHRGGLILGLGISSVVSGALGLCCCILPILSIPLGAVSWILGRSDMQQMDKGDMDPDGRSSTQAGYICGMIGCGLGIVGLLCIVLRVAIGVGVALIPGRKGF